MSNDNARSGERIAANALAEVLRLREQLRIAVDALEDYVCPGLGKCPRQRMKDGSCVGAGRDCGNPAREALDTIMGRSS